MIYHSSNGTVLIAEFGLTSVLIDEPIMAASDTQVLATRVWARIGRKVHTGVIFPATARYWQPIFGNIFAEAGPVLGRILFRTWVVL